MLGGNGKRSDIWMTRHRLMQYLGRLSYKVQEDSVPDLYVLLRTESDWLRIAGQSGQGLICVHESSMHRGSFSNWEIPTSWMKTCCVFHNVRKNCSGGPQRDICLSYNWMERARHAVCRSALPIAAVHLSYIRYMPSLSRRFQ